LGKEFVKQSSKIEGGGQGATKKRGSRNLRWSGGTDSKTLGGSTCKRKKNEWEEQDYKAERSIIIVARASGEGNKKNKEGEE